MTLPPPQPETKSIFKNPLLYSSFALAIVALVVGWIVLSRWQENKRIDRQTAEMRSEKQRENDRAALDQFGGKTLDIQSFYASPGAIHRGETVQLCYGVANAKTVRLEPQPNPVWPSYSRCVDVTPTRTTTYSLTIQDAAGNTKTQSVEVKVEGK
jgi:cytochrome oxidase Cu insertion factor (SCO1/SenC/PrrC family)